MRETSQPCNDISDRISCLTSVESRGLVLSYGQVMGNDCGWCPHGPCTNDNNNRCQPANWLRGKSINFEEGLEGIDQRKHIFTYLCGSEYVYV